VFEYNENEKQKTCRPWEIDFEDKNPAYSIRMADPYLFKPKIENEQSWKKTKKCSRGGGIERPKRVQ
jgi:hypothetical protein